MLMRGGKGKGGIEEENEGGYCCYKEEERRGEGGEEGGGGRREGRCEDPGSRPVPDLLAPIAGEALLDPNRGRKECEEGTTRGYPAWRVGLTCLDEFDRRGKGSSSPSVPLRLRGSLEAKVPHTKIFPKSRGTLSASPLVVFTLGGTFEWPERSESSLGLRTGVLQKVDVRNAKDTLGVGLDLYPKRTLRLQARRRADLPKQGVHLGILRYGVTLSRSTSGSGGPPGEIGVRAELRTPVGVSVTGEASTSGACGLRMGVQIKPTYVRGGFGLVSSAIAAAADLRSGRRGGQKERGHLIPPYSETLGGGEPSRGKEERRLPGGFLCHELSVSFQEPKFGPPWGTHFRRVPSRPKPVSPTLDAGLSGEPPQEQDPAPQRKKEIAVVGGHWIDPGGDTGAPGEREMNLHIADRVTSKLARRGWAVWRPENNEKGREDYTWPEYLDWVGDRTRDNVAVVEIHGQGKIGEIPAQGVIGDEGSPLNRVLGEKFGFFPIDYTRRGVPRHGGTIVEAFDTDEFRKLTPLERYAAAESVSDSIANSVCKAYDDEAKAVLPGCSATGCPVDVGYARRKGFRVKSYGAPRKNSAAPS
ncbi:hypothetical protein HOP50_03g27490 [Chloropicon primus]|uniref:Uncharacterized protein n=2 Tax=Chloropicon primus TaxID=1764295 RepID=A0A5B8MIY0_9CHLO|nr:hypothetical protein A3770_03p27490 [Chloropicon primus]UPQ99441.1 hypothetical protein HOP50_03g27490 [Chloropicon primus]|eukprot:QDZ20231.1 hypothetical protein A3770_03p27490 [Chloropicon primus]